MNNQSATLKRNIGYMPISWKLLGATAIVGAMGAIIAIISLNRFYTLNQNLTQTVDFLATNVKLASLVKQNLYVVTRAERNMMLTKGEDGTKRFASIVDEVATTMSKHLEELEAIATEQDQDQLDLFIDKWTEWLANHAEVRRFTAVESDIEARKLSVGDAQQTIDRLDAALNRLAKQCESELDVAKTNEDLQARAAAAEKLSIVANVSRSMLDIQKAEKDFILAPSEDEMGQYEKTIDLARKGFRDQLQLLEETFADRDDDLAPVKKASEDYLAVNERIKLVAGEKTNLLAYHFVYDIGAPIAAECELLLDGIIESKEKQMQAYRSSSERSYASARNSLVVVSILCILLSVGISFYTGQRIARRLSLLNSYAHQIQKTGDLSIPTPQLGSDEVGILANSFDSMRLALFDNAANLARQTEQLANLSQSLASKNQEMEQFVYTVSHDLKSPLVSCKGLLGLLKEDLEDGDYAAVLESTDRMDQATDQLNQIIEDLLMLSRIGRKTLHLTRVDVSRIIDELKRELEDRIEESQARIVIEEPLPVVIADRSDTRRIFENLLTNSLKYGRGVTNLTILVGGEIHADEVRYFVRDNGPGIDPKYHTRIFGLFQRLETEQPGTGLGLASIAKIMNLHGGRVWVQSTVGTGATFWLAFPLKPRQSATSESR